MTPTREAVGDGGAAFVGGLTPETVKREAERLEAQENEAARLLSLLGVRRSLGCVGGALGVFGLLVLAFEARS